MSSLARNRVIGLEIAEFEDVFAKTGEAGDVGALLDALDPLLERLTA